MSISLEQAKVVVDAALAHGTEQGFKPLRAAVLDPGGALVALARQDGSGNLRPDIAAGKAWGALGMGFGSRELFERSTKQPMFITALAAISQGRMVPVPGGVIMRGTDGDIIGAVGISGDVSDKDESCAIAGIEAAGLKAEPGLPAA